MKFALIVCTYMRPRPLLELLNSVKAQTLYPKEILIIDGSINDVTKNIFSENMFVNLTYHKVEDKDRGLTKQRNYGVGLIDSSIDVICFLDDDTILEEGYFEHLMQTYEIQPKALGVGGYITNEVQWELTDHSHNSKKFYYDGWMRDEPLRFRVRRFFGLHPDTSPCFLPTFSHGRSVSFLPPSVKTYQVEQFMGGVASYKRSVFETLKFSSYFEGYGLYEDTDFCLRLAKLGTLYVNTNAQLEHHHEVSGRPNRYTYGKMVLRNGWYIWRVKYPKPTFKARLKWHLTAILLLKLTFLGVFTSKQKKAAFTEGFGRFVGWWSVLFHPPKVDL
ncbi:MAG: glycosyl transferase family 2 [Bacteroidetes bacterium]|nr:MAG: glycosyl transferase family 2 [Bacteroidota bacterium]